jgi:iron complex transport system substrate-binding protein
VIVLPVGADLPARDALARRPGWRDLPAVREGRIVEIEADLLARPGPDLGRAARVLREGLAAIEVESR